jgi:hypothetical protein
MDGVVLRELTQRAAELGIANLAPDADTSALAPLREEEAKLADRLRQLGEDFGEGLIDRRTMLGGQHKLRARLDELTDEIAKAGRSSVWDYVDVEALYQVFDEELGEPMEVQRGVIRAAFASIQLRSRGRGPIPPTIDHLVLKWTAEWSTESKEKADAR